MDKDDIDHALHGIRMMVQVAIDAVLTMEKSKTEPGFFRLLEPDSQTLHFSLFDILKRVDELKAEQSAPNPGSDGQRSGTTGKPEVDWDDVYRSMEGPLCEAVHMAQTADGLADDVDRDDSDSQERLAFAVNHSRHLLEDLRRRYYQHEQTED
jgi:hypothetical protein